MSMQHANNAGKDPEEETFMQRIQYDELVLATDNWNQDRVLGEGGFGVVYKGNWRHTDVAIKRLKAEVGVTLQYTWCMPYIMYSYIVSIFHISGSS